MCRRESKSFDLTMAKSQLGYIEQSLQLKTMELERAQFDLEIQQGNYKNVERTLAAVQDKLTASEGEELFVANEEREALASELDIVSEELNNELVNKHEEMCRQLEDSLSSALREKEEISMPSEEAYSKIQVWIMKALVTYRRDKRSMLLTYGGPCGHPTRKKPQVTTLLYLDGN